MSDTDLAGRTVVVTGANAGLGLETSRVLAARGASVVLACRDQAKGEAALASIREATPGADVRLRALDLAELASVRKFAEDLAATDNGIDVLVNNAGVMAIPERRTADGFEMQIGTNHLGHFALTGLVLPLLARRPGARVVTVSSYAHVIGRISLDDLNWERRRYSRWLAYAQSKLANVLFAQELDRRAKAAGVDLTSVACHPGYAETNLQTAGPKMEGSALKERLMEVANRVFAQSAADGALPTIHAATAPGVAGGTYWGPTRLLGARGPAGPATPWRNTRDAELARRLWELSEELTGVRYEALSPM